MSQIVAKELSVSKALLRRLRDQTADIFSHRYVPIDHHIMAGVFAAIRFCDIQYILVEERPLAEALQQFDSGGSVRWSCLGGDDEVLRK